MADSTENILVEFDYNNIAVIDPNKIIDANGKVKERHVKHEELVMYVNLECKVIPRTKLILGSSNADNLRTISVSSMNFLNPGEKTFLDNAYTDELTGKDTLKGEGVNQQKIDKVSVPNKTNQFYFAQSTKSGKEIRATDNGLLGMKSVSIKVGLDFEPVVRIKLEDVKGKALFESGNDSPYSAFFNLPYPLFYLTIKGFYGKAVRLPLMLQDFNSSYNSGTGNFEIELTLYSYKYSVISEVTMGSMIAVPHMYRSSVQVTPKKPTGGVAAQGAKVETRTEVVEYGTQKVKEMYSEYKSKGLIPDDFPELTVVQMQKRLDRFIQTVLESFTQQNLDPLTNVTRYSEKLMQYRQEVFDYSDSWFNKYMDTVNYFVLNGLPNKPITKIYTFKSQFSANTESAISELKKLITFYNEELDTNETCGTNGKYKIDGKEVPCQIPNGIEYKIFEGPEQVTSTDIDFEATFKELKGDEAIAPEKINELKAKFESVNASQAQKMQMIDGELTPVYKYFKFEGQNSFIDTINRMSKDRKTKQDEIETALTEALAKLIKSKNSVLGFVPTIRNVLAVIFANGEAFLRLLDEVHTKAWSQRNSVVRKAPIFNVKTSGANPDAVKQGENAKVPIYPWPEFIIETAGENGQEKFETKYPGDPDVINETKAFLYDYWPEVEFVEEYATGITKKIEDGEEFPSNNELTDTKRLSINAIEYPTNNQIYNNKEEVKFFLEIYERLMLSSFYSKMSRTVNNNSELSKISQVASDIETTNIVQSLAAQNPFLHEKLARYDFNSTNFLNTIKEFSNQGVGESWQNFLRGIFNTSYIKNLVQNNSFAITSLSSPVDILGQNVSSSNVSPAVSSEKEEDIKNYITGSTNSKNFDFTDTYPFIDKDWNRKYMAGNNPIPPSIVGFLNIPVPAQPSKEYFDTTKNLTYNTAFKVISNFTGSTLVNSGTDNTPKPFSGYNFKILKMPSTAPQNATKPTLNLADLETFYNNRNLDYTIQLPTEGSLNYKIKPGLLTKNQTVSILNTPMFTNSIQESIKKFRNFDPYPYTVPAYLFLNSLPLSTLREKYTRYSSSTPPNSQQEQQSVEYMNYIFATLKKYGAIHKLPLPWILKIGSVWHRYKVWAETGNDILDNSWKPFNYLENFDPITSAATTDYALTLKPGQNVDIILQKNTNIGTQTYTQMSTGFYPQVINDFNVLYQGFRLFTGYTSPDIQIGISSGLTLVNSSNANVIMNFSGDSSNPDRFIQLNAWSAYVKTLDNTFCYILPSHGANINQVNSECFSNGKLKFEVQNNQSVFDGSVRSFWNAPNYGFFDINQIIKPNPDEYMKKIFGGFQFQENFSLNGDLSGYTNISEIFSVFEKQVLDEFEKKFLSFCRPKYNYVDVDLNATESEKNYGNFQLLFTQLMKVKIPSSGSTPVQIINELQESQIKTFSNTINGFMNYDVLFRYGNPSNFDKNLFYSFSNKEILDPFVFDKYTVATPNALPSTAGTQTLVGSVIAYPDAWKTLKEYIGFSEIPGIEYSNTGSTIFDFFIDYNVAFTPETIKACSPIIKIYATQKYLNKSMTSTDFSRLMTTYIDDNINFINKTLNDLFPRVASSLDGIEIKKERTITPTVQGAQTKLELYQTFKATNDKWISGNDFKVKTLFEDVLLFDRASRNIGDIVVVDIYQLRDLLEPEKMNPKVSMLIMVNSILKQNNFQVMNIPAYVNFYNVQEATKNPIPKPEGSLELANTLFGTFLNVDYRNSSTKMVCFYAGRPSTQLDTQGMIEGFKNDAFDLRRASDNPLVENQINKRDWDKSNKVIGFNVDIGPQNQGVFQTFSVSQKNSTPTAESLQLLTEMSKQAGNRGVATQNLSLYNLYKIRSYDCNVTMLGNALIQPMMYFNLRYVPMFSGPYMILDVSHEINSGVFTTNFTGIRQPIANLPINLDFLQTLKTNLVQKIIQKKKEEAESNAKANSKNTISDKTKILNNSNGKSVKADGVECSGITKYEKYEKIDPKTSQLTAQQLKNIILSICQKISVPSQNIKKLAYSVFTQCYLQGIQGTTFIALENNFTGIDLNSNWGATDKYFKTPNQYFCVNRGDNVFPFVSFNTPEDNIEFLLQRWKLKAGAINQPTAENIALFVNTNLSPSSSSPNSYFTLADNDKKIIVEKVTTAINLYESIV